MKKYLKIIVPTVLIVAFAIYAGHRLACLKRCTKAKKACLEKCTPDNEKRQKRCLKQDNHCVKDCYREPQK